MQTTNSISGKECRVALLQGVKDIAGPVGSTLGPSGKTVVIATYITKMDPRTGKPVNYWSPRVTKDGASVAASINPQDPLRAAGANLTKQAAIETAATAGDGTSTSVVLTEYLVEEGQKLVEAGENPHAIKAGMELALEKVCAHLKEMAIPVSGDMVRQIATISANGEQSVGNMVAEAYSSIKDTGVVVLAYSTNNSTRVESVQGMQLACGTNPVWFNEPKNLRLVTVNAVVVVTTEMVSKMSDIQKIWEYCKNEGKSLVIFAESVVGEAINTLSIPQNRNAVPFCTVPLSDLQNHKDEILQDIAIVTGATVLGRGVGRSLEKSNNEHWGTATRVEAYAGRSVIIGGGGDLDKVAERTEAIRAQIEEVGSDSTERDWHESRLAGIDGGMSCIYVGANTDGEVTELYDRYDDAIRAVRCAMKEGVLPGGGVALLRVVLNSYVFKKETVVGADLLTRSLSAPFKKICDNTGISDVRPEYTPDTLWEKIKFAITKEVPLNFVSMSEQDEILFKINKNPTKRIFESGSSPKDVLSDYGYDFKNKKFGYLVSAGVIDPAIVPITALQKAVSVAGSILTTDHILTNI